MDRELVRAVLLDGDELVLLRRLRPGVPEYFITPGGGVESGDEDLLAALHRELDEELRAVVSKPTLVGSIDEDYEGLRYRHHIFVCRLVSMDFDARYGPEFSDPGRGSYAVHRLPFTAPALADLRLFPPVVGDFIRSNVDRIRLAASDGDIR